MQIDKTSRLVIYSDLHMGNGKTTDDFLPNSGMVETILRDYYLTKDYTLILNGDIEELQRFPQAAIKKRWKGLYRIFNSFQKRDALIKLFGNHDYELRNHRPKRKPVLPVCEVLKLEHDRGDLMVFHGHQAGIMSNDFTHRLLTFILKYLATPLGIKNYSVAHDSRQRFVIEKRVYDFAKRSKIITVIGHTHRPLFESMSKVDNLKYKIDKLCRRYPKKKYALKRKGMAESIERYKKELRELIKKKGETESLFQDALQVPCVFNSGCTVGKHGITSIEIFDNNIQLVFWCEKETADRYRNLNGYKPSNLKKTDYYRIVLDEEPLDYIFTRIKLLS